MMRVVAVKRPITASGAVGLGAHGQDFDLDTLGTSPSSVTLTTQVANSAMVVLRGCQFSAVNTPTDNKGNSYTQIGADQGYAGGLWPGFGLQAWAKANAAGGASHTTQFTKTSGNEAGESSLIVIEITNGASIHTSGLVARAAAGAGANLASASITTSVPCKLISLWGGDGDANTTDQTANPSAGWTTVESLFLGFTGYIQMAAAVYDGVASAGTYSMNWVPVANQGAAIIMIAVATT